MMQRTLSDCPFLRMNFLCRRLRYCSSTATAEIYNNNKLTGTYFYNILCIYLLLMIYVYISYTCIYIYIQFL